MTGEMISKVVGFYEMAILEAAENGGLSLHDREELLDGLEALRPHVHPKRYRELREGVKAQHVLDDVSVHDYKPDLRLERPGIGYTLKRAKKAILGQIKTVTAYAVLGIVVTACAMAICAQVAKAGSNHGTYPKVLVVDSVDYEAHTVTYRDAYGFTWAVTQEDMDVSEGECYAAIMDDMGTRQIVDDTIVSMRYQRVDLLGRGEGR